MSCSRRIACITDSMLPTVSESDCRCSSSLTPRRRMRSGIGSSSSAITTTSELSA
ncbi:hypothetical protein D9M68_745200 [compost metagenome]